MTGLAAVSEATSPPLDRVLLDVKLAVPPKRKGMVSRASLVAMAARSGHRIVAVTAPAGYGKSSLLAEWAALDERRVAWVSLDRFDDDPVRLLRILASAFVAATGADGALIDEMRVHAVGALSRAAPRLAGALRASETPFVLIVDDLHVLSSAACHDVLEVVVAGVPDGSQFVSASRSTQPHVPLARTTGDVLEIGAGELALDADGAQQIFSQAQVPLTPELLETVTARTEGWPVGLRLAALIAHESQDAAAVIVGEDRYVADYLYREAFAALPADIRVFLRRTAILEHLTDDLCRTVADSPLMGGLRSLESTSVFLVPQDRTRDWYRYHPLYREFLLGELRRDEPDVESELHARAARWFEARQSPAMAIDHLLQTSDRAQAGPLVDAVGLRTYQAGELSTVQRWLAALGDAGIGSYPPLQVFAGWTAVLTGDTAAADRWAAVLQSSTFEGTPADGSASFESSRALLLAVMCAHGPDRMREEAEFALAAESAASPWRDLALYEVGDAYLLLGDVDAAEQHFSQITSRPTPSGNTGAALLAHAHLAMISMTRRRWDAAGALLETAVEVIEDRRVQDYGTSVPTYVALARLALHRGDLVTAKRELTRAMRTRPVCTAALPTVSVPVRIHLARMHWTLGDAATARHLLREADDILLQRPLLGALVDDVEALRTLVSTSVPGPQSGPPLTPAELRLLPYLQTHLSIPEIGARLFVSRNTVSTQVSAIYRKLGVSSRSEAVDRGTAIGLLG